MNAELVHVIVVAYGSELELEQCLAAVEPALPMTVVDNSSSDRVRRVAENHDARYIDPGTNLGFGAGANVALRGLKASPPRYVLLLNPDAVLPPADLSALVAYLSAARNARVAAASPRVVDTDGATQRVVWPFPSLWRAWLEALGFGRFVPVRRFFVIGAVLMLRWSAIEQVGFFDERFFLYAEETDWQRRASTLRWTSAVCGEATATHLGAGTSADNVRRETLFHAGQETYIRKWFGTGGWWIYRLAEGGGAGLRAIMLRGERREAARLRLTLYRRGPRRYAGLV